MRRSTWVAIGIAVVLFVGIGFAAANSGGDASGQVKVACRHWVEARVPSAAISGESLSRDGETYIVTGLADGERYRCEATNDGEASHLVRLTGLD